MKFDVLVASVAAGVLSLLVAAIMGKGFIPFLRRKHFGQEIREDGPKWHASKAGTPTMGGFLFIVGILAAAVVFIFAWIAYDGNVMLPAMIIFLFALGFGAIGFLDDFVKVAKHRNLGLNVIQKLVLQIAWSLAFVSYLRFEGFVSPDIAIPFTDVVIHLEWVVYLVFAVLAIVATVNAVNFTDGVDGLLGCVTLPVMVFFVVAGACEDNVSAGVIAGATAGGVVGFLIYNFNPAKVFMGDTGSLFLGGMVCALAFTLNMPLIIPIVGLIYVIEILSVVLQVVYFKATHGKRLFRMSPIHHHFEMGGWSEKKICLVFGGITLVMCIIGYISLYGFNIWVQ